MQLSQSVERARLCSAWVNFNGTGVVEIRDSHNVSSITDNGTGDYTINFDKALRNANYTVTTTDSQNETQNLVFNTGYAPTVNGFGVMSFNGVASKQDYPHVMAAVHGG